ncbi:phage major tail protein [Escherichia coli]|nr:phage major tail protein [Escherichia coli]
MSSNFERSQLTKIMISSAPVTAETLDSASYLGLSCTIKEVQFTAGQKQDMMSPRCVLLSRKILTALGLLQRFPCQATFI